ncbi:MAG: OmpH family outer membrane protein [Acidobacteriota bacterium]|jgi:outer membrane protein|nr:OmpH family outer membrane protein [Acidobacteriota bacterium]
MNRFLLAVFIVALTLPAAGVAQTAATAVHAPTVKIGWLDADQVIQTCDEGARIMADMQKFVDAKNAELDAMRREFEELRNRLEVQAAKLTDEALMDLDEKASSQELKLQRFQEDTQRDITARRQRLINNISAKIGPIIEKVALEKGLDAILLLNPQRDAWINPALNVTEDVIKAYNQAYPAGVPTIPPAAKKP